MKKIIISTMILFTMFTIFSFKVNKEICSANTNLSNYINTNKDAIFEKEVELAPLYEADKYVVGVNSPLLNESELTINRRVEKDFLVRVNGEYYDTSFKLKEGINNIEIRRAEMKENTFTPTKEILEKFNILVEKENETKIEVFYEHFETKEEMYNEIYNKTNKSLELKKYEKRIKEAYRAFEIARNESDNYYDTKLDVNITFKENNNKYNIKLLSAKNSIYDNDKITDINELINDKYLNVAYDFKNVEEKLRGEKIKYEHLEKNIIKVKGNKNQAFGIEVVNEVNFPQNVYYSNPVEKVILEYRIVDLVYGDVYEYMQTINFFHHQKYKEKYITKLKEKNTTLEVYKEYNDPNNFIEEIESYINLENSREPLYLAVKAPLLTFLKKPNTNTVGSDLESLEMKFEAKYEDSTTSVSLPYKVLDTKAPKILAKTNIIVLDKEKVSYTENFRVIDNYTLTKDLETTYKKIEEDKYGGIIRVSVKDKSGNLTVSEIPFRYKTTVNFFRKIMYDYSETIKNMFL